MVKGINMKRIFRSNKSDLTPKRVNELLEFSKRVHLHFKDLSLLDLAFHHRSYSNENAKAAHYNNERLEFLGDSVLGMSTASYLYDSMENPEGDLARIKSAVVSEESLSPIAVKLGLDKLLILGRGEELSGGRHKNAILADCVEAVLGAYYLDKGFEEAKKWILTYIIPEIDLTKQNKSHRDYKTLLQEYNQKKCKQTPVYKLIKTSGPDHDQLFLVTVELQGQVFGPAEGKNKKSAEQKAAQLALEALSQI